ncbi:hypothetical protein [uncultured Erythrobacter sp.]|uniref:hypothetical protein n=1 Tax=uncultured Erythrobacter sp. TaxID=263913 RepID=UPI00261F5E2E|nr:hypothetical protein [uncultured Erythrobacter sp.]
MEQEKRSSWPLVLMLLWYGLLLAGSALVLLMGLMFGSEVYRGRPMPFVEWAIILGPFVVSLALLLGTIFLWNTGRRTIAYALCGLTLIAAPILLLGAGALGI